MIAPLIFGRPARGLATSHVHASEGLIRVFSAAVVNRQFQDMLLQDPAIALARGYLGEKFILTKEEHDLVLSIRAKSLPDLAKQVNRSLSIEY